MRPSLEEYMDIKKCKQIKEHETCKFCGWELSFYYEKDEKKKKITQHIECQKCGKIYEERVYSIL